MKQGFVIAIDGPAAAGKGTIVQLLSKHFKGVNIYAGGMYRSLAYECIRRKVSLTNEKKVVKTLDDINITFGDESEDGSTSILLDGGDVTQEIRIPEVALGAGVVASMNPVRMRMDIMQKSIVNKLILEGRIVIIDSQDAALVFPDARIKIFLTASQEKRAQRRLSQYIKSGLKKTEPEMLEEIKARDERDFSRSFSPLSQDPRKHGYFYLDTSSLDEYETLDVILDYIKQKNI